MREILFRGKDIKGNWYEGLLCHNKKKNEWYISNKAGIPTAYQVRPETIGQYTGLTDKNGVKIFDGDILKIRQLSDTAGTYFFPPIEYPVNVIVKWDLCAWLWEVIGTEKYYITFPDAWCRYECKVIGNIYDNPELVK